MTPASALSPSERRLLIRVSRNRRVVEAGTLLGGSALVLAEEAAGVVTSIDRHEGYGPPTWRAAQSNIACLPHNAPIRLVKAEIESVLPDVEADVAFIDLMGTRDATTRALRSLHPSIWLAAIHDFGRQNCAGVETAIDASPWRVIERADTLVILERKP